MSKSIPLLFLVYLSAQVSFAQADDRETCNKGDGAACFQVYNQILATLKGDAKTSGSVPSLHSVSGSSVAKAKLDEAESFLEKAAQLGDLHAMVEYATFKADQRDFVKAADWYKRAAEKGDAVAQTSLGMFYSEGMGLNKNEKKAAEWFLKAAKQGEPTAQVNAGAMYKEGTGVKKSSAKALEWFNKVAAQDQSSDGRTKAAAGQAHLNLGVMYLEGDGVKKNRTKADFHLKKASALGLKGADQLLKELAAEEAPLKSKETSKDH